MRKTDLTHPLQDMDTNPPPKIRVKNLEELTSPIPNPCESRNYEIAKNPSNLNFDELISIQKEETHFVREINIDDEVVIKGQSVNVKCLFCHLVFPENEIKVHEEEYCQVRNGRSICIRRFRFDSLNNLDDEIFVSVGGKKKKTGERKNEKCSFCQKEIDKSFLKNHLENCRARRKGFCPFECHSCGKKFSTEQGLSDHVAKKHKW